MQVVNALGDYMDCDCHACIGGTSVRSDIIKLEGGVHVIVGTPGRVLDMISRKSLGTSVLNDRLVDSQKITDIISCNHR